MNERRGRAAALYGRGLLGMSKISADPNLSLTAATGIDIPGLASIPFVYQGRPVRAVARFPYSKYSIITANQALNLIVVDVDTAAGQCQVRSPALPLNTTDVTTLILDSAPQTALISGASMVPGQTYTWKLQVGRTTTNGIWNAAYGGAFYGFFAIFED